MLSSDILENQFGPTQVVVLKQTTTERIIQTVSVDTGQVLELSFVYYVKGGAKGFDEINNQIIAGESMGKAFRRAGVVFYRDTKTQSKVILPHKLQKYFANNGEATVLEVPIFVGRNKQHYCNILEIYSPVVKWPTQHADSNPNISFKIEKSINQLQ